MVKKAILLMVLALLLGVVTVSAETWNVDKSHSSIGFKVRHLVISKTSGEFTDFSGSVEFDGKDLAGGTASLTVQMASIDTEDEDRDKHLKSPDFFDIENHPTMTFQSKKITASDGNEFKLVGDMTIKGVTKEVTFDCEFHGVANDPWGNTRAGFSAETKIDRQEFGVSFNKVLETGGLVVGNEVEITLEVELVKAG